MKLPRAIFSDNCEHKQYTAEASDLVGWSCGDPTITVASDTCEATFQLIRVERSKDEDNEILAWEYTPTIETLNTIPRLIGWKVTIFND